SLDQRGLARARRAADQEQARAAARGLLEGALQRRDLGVTAVQLLLEDRAQRRVGDAEVPAVRDAAGALELIEAGGQGGLERARRLVAQLRILLEKLQHDALERARHVGADRAQRPRPLRDVRVHQLERILRIERRAAREQVVERGAESVQIAAEIHAAIHA